VGTRLVACYAHAAPTCVAASRSGEFRVPQCKSCGEEADELVPVKIDGKTKKVCESCADLQNEQETIKQDSEAVVQNMMGFKGRR
jgi:ribosome-binding protein aMBF1 (putative translation factor)